MDINQYEERIKELETVIEDLTSHNNVSVLQKEMLFREAIEKSIPSGIAVVDDTGKQIYVNQSFCNIFGWEKDELLTKVPPYVYWYPGDMDNINNAFKQTLANNTPPAGFDLLFQHKTGRIIPVHVLISPFVQEKNRTYFLANVIDITERKEAEKILKKSELLLTYSIESQKDTIIFSIDLNYYYLYFNKAHTDAMKFAYNKDVNTGMNFLDCISSDVDKKLLKGIIDKAFHGESNSIVQTFGKTNIAYYEVFFNPILNENGDIIGCSSLARNISDRQKAEQALKDSEIKFREIINQINDTIIVFDEQGKIIIWNRGAEQICGLKAENALNRRIAEVQYEFTPPKYKDKALIENTINNIITFKTPERFNQIIDSEIISLDSEKTRNIQSMIFPVDLNGYHLFCTVIRDVTEIKQYEKEILKISAEKDKFYSVIAQYLYTPFSLFHNFATLMAKELDTLPLKEIQKMVELMSKSATNLYSLLDNMLQWTRMNQGKFSFNPQKLNFKTISHDAVSILKPNADEKNITINNIVDGEIIVLADIFMLKTILRNLVSNAIKVSSNNGQVEITARKTESNITVSVLDDGVELTPGYINRMFNTSDIHSALGSSEEKGTTLGLLLCREFVEKHGGKIWVESKSGKGSEFNFTIPSA